MISPTSTAAWEPELYRWSRADFRHFLNSGVVEDPAHFELIDGLIFRRPMENPPHRIAVGLAQDALEAAFGPDFHVRCQSPLALADDSEPEPDLAVVRGKRREYAAEHPTTALLVVEVADSTLRLDQGRKLREYARNGIPEYWIVNLTTGQFEVHRDPSPETESYREKRVLARNESVSPSAQPEHRIPVSELLP